MGTAPRILIRSLDLGLGLDPYFVSQRPWSRCLCDWSADRTPWGPLASRMLRKNTDPQGPSLYLSHIACVCLCTCLRVSLLIVVHTSAWQRVCLCVCMYLRLSVCLSLCLFSSESMNLLLSKRSCPCMVSWLVYLAVCLFVCMYVSICLSVCIFVNECFSVFCL